MTRMRGESPHEVRPLRLRLDDPSDPAHMIDRFPTPTLLLVELGRLAHANHAATTLLQLDDDRQIAAAVEDFLGLRNDIEQAHRLDRPSEAIWRDLTIADGTQLRVQLFLTPLGESPYRSTLVHLVDRTAEHRLASFVERSTPGFEAMFRRLPVMAAVVGRSGLVEFWNDEAERRLGVSAGAAVGRSLTSVLQLRSDTLWREIETALVTGRRLDQRPLVIRPESADALTVDLSLEPWITDQGETNGAIITLADVSHRDTNERRHARSALLYHRMLTSLDDSVNLIDANGNLIGERVFESDILGYPESFWHGRDFFALIDPKDRQGAVEWMREANANPGRKVKATFRMRDQQSRWQYIAATALNLLDDPSVGAILVVSKNVTDSTRQAAQRDAQSTILQLIAEGGDLGEILEKIAEFLDSQLDQAVSAVVLGEPDIVRFGEASMQTQKALEGLRLTAFDGSAASRTSQTVSVYDVGQHPWLADHSNALAAAGRQAVWSHPIQAAGNEPLFGQIIGLPEIARDPNGHEFKMVRLASSMAALAVERLRAGELLARRALHDDLTGLANRHLLINRLDQALARARRTENRVGLMFIDLDRFKVVNDTFGHEAGDAVLKAFASRLNELLRDADTVARYGGDEFIVLIDEVTEEHLRDVATRVEERLAMPVAYGSTVFEVTSSIGLAISDGDAESATKLLQNADAAMYRAKRSGRKRLEVFDHDMAAVAVDRARQESDLRRSIDRGAMLLHYQPVIDLRSGRVVGAEALVRWNHPDKGILEPAEFLPLAEENGYIGTLGRWILDEALRYASSWATTTGHRDLWISVNISSRQLVTAELPALVRESLQKHRWNPDRLILEVGESVLLADIDLIKNGLTAIHDLGVDLAIDDFGIGTASLTTLAEYAVDRIKIDGEIVRRLGADEQATKLVRAIIDSAHALGMGVTAEGVEQPAQLDLLRSLGCDWAQGFHFHPGMTPRELLALLQTNAVW